MTNIFVYGTLQNPEVVEALTGKSFKQTPYVLNGYKVFQVKGEHFPGMVKSKGSSAKGYILYDVDKKAFEIINKWEGTSYTPNIIKISADSNEIEAITYIWKDEMVLEGNWSNEIYRTTHMWECVEKCIPQELGLSSN